MQVTTTNRFLTFKFISTLIIIFPFSVNLAYFLLTASYGSASKTAMSLTIPEIAKRPILSTTPQITATSSKGF